MSDSAELASGRSDTPPEETQWQSHRAMANVLRVAVSLAPVSVAALVGFFASRTIPDGFSLAFVVRVGLAAVSSLIAFLVVERLGRRFLPLAALLRLNLVFPDRAPSRFSVALRSTSVRKLERWVQEAREEDNAALLAKKVVTLASALNTHDRRTRGHCERTRALADLISEELRLSPREANEVRWGAFLHDIGKLVVPADILNKPGKPTTREWEVLKSHPEAGARLVEPLRHFLSSGVDAVGSHHENYDGSGYPAGLSGDELPLAARIVSVADSFEVMTAVRAYKRPMTMQAAREELTRRSGTQFDPHVVRALLNVSLGRLHWVLGVAAWLAEMPFVSILPRVVAQVSTSASGGVALSPIALPGVAAASLGAIAVIGHVDPSKVPTEHPAHLSASAHPVAASPPPSASTAATQSTTTQSTVTPVNDVPPVVAVPGLGPPPVVGVAPVGSLPALGVSLSSTAGVEVHVAATPLGDVSVHVPAPTGALSHALAVTGDGVGDAIDTVADPGVQSAGEVVSNVATGATDGLDLTVVLGDIPEP